MAIIWYSLATILFLKIRVTETSREKWIKMRNSLRWKTSSVFHFFLTEHFFYYLSKTGSHSIAPYIFFLNIICPVYIFHQTIHQFHGFITRANFFFKWWKSFITYINIEIKLPASWKPIYHQTITYHDDNTRVKKFSKIVFFLSKIRIQTEQDIVI